MRETLKSLSIFSAMLLLLLLISSGCDVNIPGCGKRTLPFFKPVTPPATALPSPAPTAPPAGQANPPGPTGIPAVANPAPPVVTKPVSKPQALGESSIEMSITKSKLNFTPTSTATATPTSTPQEMEKFAYTTVEDGKPTLWTMNTDGTNRVRLTPRGTSSWFPLWSPYGKVLAFLSDMNDKKINLYLVKKDGSGIQQLTNFDDFSISNLSNLKPPFSWSPTGDEIAFCYRNQVWKLNINNLSQETLASEDPNYIVTAVEWAPHRETKYVAYLVKQGQNYYDIKLVNPRLKDQLRLDSNQPMSDLSWTPDARNVAYLIGGNSVYTASSQTSLPKMLLANPSPQLGPLLAYSPSETGTALMLLAKKNADDQDYRVALMDKASTGAPDTGTLKFLTDPGVDYAIWSPDGSKIAYVQAGDLWVMDAPSGAKKTRIAAIGIQSPSWAKK